MQTWTLRKFLELPSQANCLFSRVQLIIIIVIQQRNPIAHDSRLNVLPTTTEENTKNFIFKQRISLSFHAVPFEHVWVQVLRNIREEQWENSSGEGKRCDVVDCIVTRTKKKRENVVKQKRKMFGSNHFCPFQLLAGN